MSDDIDTTTEENQEKPKKQMKGFALPENRKNIKRGRTPGAKNKVMSEKDFVQAILKRDAECIETLVKLMRTGNDSTKAKVAFKLLDLAVEIRKNGEELSVSKTDKDGNKEEYTVSNRATGTGGKVVDFGKPKFLSTEFEEDK